MSRIAWMIAGAGALLTAKYLVVGLHQWNHTLHPSRVEDPSSPFMKPLLGIFS